MERKSPMSPQKPRHHPHAHPARLPYGKQLLKNLRRNPRLSFHTPQHMALPAKRIGRMDEGGCIITRLFFIEGFAKSEALDSLDS